MEEGHAFYILPHLYPDQNTWQMYGLIAMLRVHIVICEKHILDAFFVFNSQYLNKGSTHRILQIKMYTFQGITLGTRYNKVQHTARLYCCIYLFGQKSSCFQKTNENLITVHF